jgi:prepilin-type N-terminal cleavage/methylation domain-containing protein
MLSGDRMYNKQKAFTLAEVLITLLIIGVIASLVIPAIINDTQKQELYTSFKKEYSNIGNAAKLMMSDNGGSFVGMFDDQSDMMNDFGNYLVFTKKCSAGLQGCFYTGTSSWKVLSGQDGWFSFTDYPTAIMNDGSFIRFYFASSDCSMSYGAGSYAQYSCGWIDVDVNGPKKPNVLGRDIFRIFVTRTGIYPSGIPKETYSDTSYFCNKDVDDQFSGRACAIKVLKGEDIP